MKIQLQATLQKEPEPKTTSEARKQWDADPKLRAEFGDNFAAYDAYQRAAARGQVKRHAPAERK